MAASRSSAARAAVDRSFEELYRGHRADVFRAALRELGNVHDAEDVTQAAFVDAYRAVLRGSQPQSPRAWLLAIAENVRRRRYRTAMRRPREEPIDADFPLTADLPYELARTLAEALSELPQDQRAVFVLREIGGLSYEEIAEETGTTVGAIQMQLFRARRSLRERLEPPTVTRRRTGLFALPGWATTLFSRADVALLTPRAAGAVGAAAAAVVGATIAVSEVAPLVPEPVVEARPAAVSSSRAADPVLTPTARSSATVASTQVTLPRLSATVRRPKPVRAKPKPAGNAPAIGAAPSAPTPTAAPAPAPQSRPTAAPVAVQPVVRATVEKVQRVLELPRLPVRVPVVPVPVVEAERVLEAPGIPPLPTAPVPEVVPGAARAAGGGAQPLPVPGLPPVTVPPAP